MPAPTLSLNDRQEPYSLSFIGAIAAAAGYGFKDIGSGTNPDRSSIDAQISIPSTQNVLIQDLKIQAKCTYYHQLKNNHLPFRINKKNYNDIRLNRNPHLLLVVNIPKPDQQWIRFGDKFIELSYNCYYKSLTGMDEMEGDSKTLKIPADNILTVSKLSEIMNLLSEGRFINHNNEIIDL